MAVGVERHESMPEVELHRGLRNRPAAGCPFAILGVDGGGVSDCERQLAAPEARRRRRLHRVLRPQAEHHSGIERKQGEGGTGLDRRVPEELAVECGAGGWTTLPPAKYWQTGAVSRADRLLRLIQVLRRHRRPVSAQQLADELEISIRSVYRDVQTLRAEGATIDGEPGVGYVLRPGFLLPPLMFTDEELEALLLGLRLTAVHADDALARAAAEVVAKLRAVLPKDLRVLLDEIALSAGPALSRPEETVDLAELRRAIREQRAHHVRHRASQRDHARDLAARTGLFSTREAARRVVRNAR